VLPAKAGATPCAISRYCVVPEALTIWKSFVKKFIPGPIPVASPTILEPDPARVMVDVFMEGVDTLPVMIDPAGASDPDVYVWMYAWLGVPTGTGSLIVIELVNRTRPVGKTNMRVEASVEPAVMVNALPPGEPTSGIAICIVPELAKIFPLVRFSAVSNRVIGAPLMFRPPLRFIVEAKIVDWSATEPAGGGYTWPLMKSTLLILTAERLDVMTGSPPVFVIPAVVTNDDVVSRPFIVTDDMLLIFTLFMELVVAPVTRRPPSTFIVEANMVEGVAPVIPL
jgi:hypothetical protein